jgi:hypothetical protein
MQRSVCGLEVLIRGKLFRTISLRNEGYEFIDQPEAFSNEVRRCGSCADLLTFTQSIGRPDPIYDYHRDWDQLAVLPITTYEEWWKRQINDKTRNMVRKAGKKGVVLMPFQLDEQAIRGIKAIYDESPIRQGKPFKHYGKDLQTLFREHATFIDRSEFIGAFLDEMLIGFVKLVHQAGWSSMMQIISLTSQRDKAPTNALIAKSVEICGGKGVPYLQYGIWSRRGIGEFKEHHCFRSFQVPRYYVPISSVGRVVLSLGMHKQIRSRIPDRYFDRLIEIRAGWFKFKQEMAIKTRSKVGMNGK